MQSLILDEEVMEKPKTVIPPTQKKRRHDDKGQDPPTRLDQGLKKRKTSKNAELSKRTKSTSSSKGTSQSQPKSTGKSDDWFKKPTRPHTPDPEWITRKSVDNGPEQSWLNDLANAKKPPLTFDDLMSTITDFSAFAMNRFKTRKLTKVNLVGPVYNLLKGTCKSCVELEYNIEEFYRAFFDQLDWNTPEGNRCPYDLSKPLPLHKSRGRLNVLTNFLFNNDLEYLRGGSTDRKYMTSTTKIKDAKVSRHDVYSTIRILSVTNVTVD
ncbi:hypothetical protein Tco_1401917 [Tanacetum coccineum]